MHRLQMTIKALFLLLGLAIGGLAPISSTLYAAGDDGFLVLGVIASGSAGQGVALLKSIKGDQAFAVRAGMPVLQGGKDVIVERITRDYVYFKRNGHIEQVRVGEQLGPAPADPVSAANIAEGVERTGNTVKITSALREHVLKGQLSQVLMQAAAVPYYVNNELSGFRLWDIDAGSIYEKIGFVNGDIITSINGQRLSDVGMAIRTLQTLKDETSATVTFLRKGEEQTVQITIQ